MRRLNFYRWLVGLEPAGSNPENQRAAQIAAMMMDVNRRLDHNPPEDWRCYDPEGARAAGMSNLGLGYSTPAQTLIGYIGDTGVESLGHRRWALFPALNDVGFGHRGRGAAMFVFGRTQRDSPDFVAFPPPGPVPAAVLEGVWSFSRQGIGDPEVRVTEVGSERALAVESTALRQGYGLDTVAIRLGESPRTGTTYRVEVGAFTYETTLVACQ
jgi:hypothetical protein